jgi:hypothetical protein
VADNSRGPPHRGLFRHADKKRPGAVADPLTSEQPHSIDTSNTLGNDRRVRRSERPRSWGISE